MNVDSGNSPLDRPGPSSEYRTRLKVLFATSGSRSRASDGLPTAGKESQRSPTQSCACSLRLGIPANPSSNGVEVEVAEIRPRIDQPLDPLTCVRGFSRSLVFSNIPDTCTMRPGIFEIPGIF